MILVGVLVAILWLTGMAMGTPKLARWIMITVLMSAVIAVQLLLPAAHPLRMATGGDARLWLLLAGLAGVVWGYAAVLRRIKTRAKLQTPDQARKGFSDDELTRYARHIMLREIGGPGQKALHDAKVLVVGAGGLGSPALLYLTASGVGTIGVIDDDVVDASNLQRQVIHRDSTRGLPKVQSATQAMFDLNPHITLRPYDRRLTADIAADLIGEYDLVLDGCDNFDTRDLVNASCVAAGVPLISAAMTQWEGQISLYHPASGAPCYACVFPHRPAPGLVPTCAEAGVIGPLPGVMGSMMAVEAVKALTQAGQGLGGRLLIYDALYADTRIMQVAPRADCKVCHGQGLKVREERGKVQGV